MQFFDGFTLKLIMVVLMVFDHVAQFIPNTPYWFHWLGRLVAPIFFYLLVEGYEHTRNRNAYMMRLFKWGGIMFIGNILVSYAFKRNYFVTNNIFLSMAMGIALLIAIDGLSNKEGRNKVKNIFLIFIICLVSLFTEGSFIGTAMVLIFFYFKKDKIKMSIAYILLSSIFLTGGFTYDNLFVLNPQWMMVFSLPFMLMYNGKRGFNLKYFFYIFYPLHIWILYIMGYFIELRY